MKYIITIVAIIVLFSSCHSIKQGAKHQKESIKLSGSENDSTEYELIIFDPKYDTYLLTQPSMQFYSNEYYQLWNMRYVTEWNMRHNNPIQYGDFYETQIDYQFNVDYGIELNYRLYYYFLFIEKEYGITLIRRGKTSK